MNTTMTTRNKVFDAMQADFGYKNVMQAPKVVKIVVSSGVGKMSKDKKRLELIVDRLARITGQAPAERSAKKAIANFKSRRGDIVGYQITLRGARAEAFLQKLIHIVFPRTKDFRGISPKAIDEMGNITIGIKEHTVFPEAADEDSKDSFGLAITIATTAKNKKEAESFLRHLGLPLQAGK
ncbi:50S ribosomal protein L5 [Candidatus Kaiserbacteria bacterium RIFCSPHIGHO2_01_FULL_55_17]|uniref:Large ribosomal subunit protein uL5 n=1 Tax=Candidatus Kaiserbacteria bacterium RIFCSPHIGHO2_01_FULL_55_17 TaxID=1798484 RepID=A0A1F6D7U6_9BACT|nr:MAG: 50S ribosomal protein L5 [Candidatus Kaiserbacteria bacterium RIFCSPHIGHO2_01_FULL_55_17]